MSAAPGPLPLGLAMHGAFACLERRRQWRTWWAVALAAVPVIGGFADPGMLAPVCAGVWCLSAIGLSELFRGSHGRLKIVVPGLLIASLLILLEARRFNQREAALAPADAAHASLTASAARRALRALPTAAIVAEDASVNLLLRAAASSPRRDWKAAADRRADAGGRHGRNGVGPSLRISSARDPSCSIRVSPSPPPVRIFLVCRK